MEKIMKNILLPITMIFAILVLSQESQAGHSSKGCSNCHIPHKALVQDTDGRYGVPLWNPAYNADTPNPTTFNLYTSPTFDALSTGITQPDGPSKLCLGCHDGSYVSATSGKPISLSRSFSPVNGMMTFTESHPISFVYNSALATSPKLRVAGELKDPSVALSGLPSGGTIASDLLDKYGKMQCISCHDVHASGVGEMLRFDYDGDLGKTLCRTCHNK